MLVITKSEERVHQAQAIAEGQNTGRRPNAGFGGSSELQMQSIAATAYLHQCYASSTMWGIEESRYIKQRIEASIWPEASLQDKKDLGEVGQPLPWGVGYWRRAPMSMSWCC